MIYIKLEVGFFFSCPFLGVGVLFGLLFFSFLVLWLYMFWFFEI